MIRTQKARFDGGRLRAIKRLSMPIGIRLCLAFLVIILLTGLIGILAIQQFSSLTHTATEINAHDLPKATVMVHLRSLLYQQHDLEYNLINDNSTSSSQLTTQQAPDENEPSDVDTIMPTSTSIHAQSAQMRQQTLSELTTVLKDIDEDCQQLLSFEKTEPKDLPQAQKIVRDLLRTREISIRIQTLTGQAAIAQARMLDLTVQEPLLQSTIAALTQLGSVEQNETANDAIRTQRQSEQATLLVFALTALSLVLSIVLAIAFTRSLTRPLRALLHTTEAIAAGNLDVEVPIQRMDEIGRLALAYDKMRLSLRSTIASLSRERQHTQAIIDATADGVILLDETFKVLKCNPAAERLSGWAANETLGKYCWEVLGFAPATPQEAQEEDALFPLMTALQNRPEQSYLEMLITARTGAQRWLALSCAPMPLDEQDAELYTVLGLHDISQLKRVDQMKSDFVAMVSHELRAPLTTVTGSVELLSQLEPSADPDTYHEVLGILDQQVRRLRQVVEEVLQLTRFDAGHLDVQLQPLPIHDFLHTLIEKTNEEWLGSDHCIILYEVAKESMVWADASLLTIVLRNLFENARKYTPLGTVVQVEIESFTATDQVEIRVTDNGLGIPKDQLEHIFERFSRGTQSADNWTRGYGLGLYISRKLIQAHNGSIRVENRQPGTCFVLSLWMVTDDDPFYTAPGLPATSDRRETTDRTDIAGKTTEKRQGYTE